MKFGSSSIVSIVSNDFDGYAIALSGVINRFTFLVINIYQLRLSKISSFAISWRELSSSDSITAEFSFKLLLRCSTSIRRPLLTLKYCIVEDVNC